MILSPHEIASLALERWTVRDLAVTATAIALAESGGDTDALARSTVGDNTGQRDHGLWQISGRWHGPLLAAVLDWRDPVINAMLAWRVWTEAGHQWTPWSAYKSGAYSKFLPDAEHGMKAPFPPQRSAHMRALDVLGHLDRLSHEVERIGEHFT